MQQQDIQPQEKINSILKVLQFITNESQGSYIQGEMKKKKILLFFGFNHEDVDALYVHFIDKSVIVQNEYIKMVKLKKQSKVSYLINTPHSLGNIANRQLCLKQCITRIILNKVLLQFKDCDYHIIVNFQNLQGVTLQEQLNQITDFGLFNFGKIMFKQKCVSILFNCNNNIEISYGLVIDNKKGIQEIKHILKQQTLRYIFKKDIFYQPKIEKSEEDFGPMSIFLIQIMEDFAVQITIILENYKDQLLILQQIPILQDYQDLKNSIVRFLNQLNDYLKKQSNYNLEFTQDLFKEINTINNNHRVIINTCLSRLNTNLIRKFLVEKGISSLEQLYIPEVLVNIEEIDFINKMLKKYIQNYFESQYVPEIKNLKQNIKYWNSYSSTMVESIIQNYIQISQNIQEGPEEQRDFGVFLFGKSKVGKSTLINILKNPESLTIEQRINELGYVMKNQFQTEFRIGHGCMSETQQISSMKIGDVWIYDCPGFDDNISQQIRIAHWVSLQNYLAKTKKVIGFFLIDSSNNDAQIIKDTFDPIYLLLKDKNQLLQENHKWASLVLVKTKENTRKNYIENWDEAYQNLLEGRYTFYREMYQNDNSCIEFPKPKRNLSDEQIIQQNTLIQQKMLKKINENKENQEFELKLNLYENQNTFPQYELFFSILGLKIEQIVGLLENQINTYILDCVEKIKDKKLLTQKFKSIIVNEINQNNVKQTLNTILDWCKINEQFKINSIFLQKTIDDVLKCLRIENYIKRSQNSTIKVDSSILKKNAKKIISIIESIENIELALKTSLVISSIAAAVASLGISLIAEGIIGIVVAEYVSAEITRKATIWAAINGQSEISDSTISFIKFTFRSCMLREKYQLYLKKQRTNM